MTKPSTKHIDMIRINLFYIYMFEGILQNQGDIEFT